MTARRLLLVALNVALLAIFGIILQPAAPEVPATAGRSLAAKPVEAKVPQPETLPNPPPSKPLFRERPAPTVVAEPTEKVIAVVPSFRLAGVVWGDSEQLAVVQLAGASGHRRVRRGETVDEWNLSHLTQRTATFEAGDRRIVLTLKSAAPPIAEQD
jgi:hypothetical protein